MPASQKLPRLLRLTNLVACFALAAALAMVLFYAPVEIDMGLVQKVFYFHVACTWTGMLGFLLSFAAAVAYLKTGDPKWDIAGLAGIEIGMVFVGLGILSGSIWARPIWNTWWTWDPRLTTTLIMELIYAAYLLLRSGVDEPARRARFAAIYAIVGFVSVPLTFLSIRIFRTIHPVIVGGSEAASSSGFAMSGRMQVTFFFSLFAFTLLFIALFWNRYRLGKLNQQLEEQKMLLEGEEEE